MVDLREEDIESGERRRIEKDRRTIAGRDIRLLRFEWHGLPARGRTTSMTGRSAIMQSTVSTPGFTGRTEAVVRLAHSHGLVARAT